MYFYLSVLSFILYSFLVLKLFLTSFVSSFSTGHYLISAAKLIIIVFLIYEFFTEWRVYLIPKKSKLIHKPFTKRDLFTFLSVLLSTICSYLIHHNVALGAVVASSLVGLIGALLISNYSVSIYCGSFAGMVSNLLTSNVFSLLTIGVLAGIFFVIGSETFRGFGGKLGATAYFATLLSSLFFKNLGETMTGLEVTLQVDVFIVFIIGSLGTYFINEKYQTGAVVASSLLGLTFGLILPNVFTNGHSLAVALFCGTFIGMSTTTKLSTKVSVMIATAIGTAIYLYTAPYFAGLGGKLGLIAFGSVIATAGLYNLKEKVFSS